VIVLDPCYDSYVPNIELAGGKAVRVPLTPGTFRPDFAKISAAITPRTRAIIINSPHNPSATIWTAEECASSKSLLAPTDILLISDEVYEHMVFDGAEHQSAARFAGLAARAFIVSSFGKTFHVTGWKVGTVAAPAALTAEFRKVHQFNVFTVNTPMQHGLAAYLQDPAPYLQLPAFYQAKRDLFRQGLEGSRLKLLPSTGSYFQCVDISAVSDLNESDFCQWLTREIGVAAIPLSAFYGDGFDQRVVRFCFAKKDETRPLGEEFVKNAPLTEVRALLASQGLPTDYIDVPYTPFLVVAGGRKILIDTGLGEFGGPTTGKLLDSLRAAGMQAADIDTVLISHFHGDHINGLRNKAGE
jgi:methionine aminotransferase